VLDAFAVTPAGSAPDTIANLGSAAAARVDDCRICFTDGAIGQGSGRDGNCAEASRAEKEQQGEYASLHNPMLPILCRFPSVTEVRRLLLRSSQLQRSPVRQHPPKDTEVSSPTDLVTSSS